MQFNVNTVVVWILLTACPLILLVVTLPDQPAIAGVAVAEHVFISIVCQASVAESPSVIVAGVALKKPISGLAGITDTETVLLPVPPGPVQVSVKLVLAIKLLTISPAVLLVFRLPSQPPLAEHELASVEDQVSAVAEL